MQIYEIVGLSGLAVAVIGVIIGQPSRDKAPNTPGVVITLIGMAAFVGACVWKFTVAS